MNHRICHLGLRAVLLLAWIGTVGEASEHRETPLVRAVKRARSAVVNINTEKTAPAGDALFSSGKSRKVNGMGTGIVIDERGYVVTNYHVVNGVDLIEATLDDGSMYTARVVSFDRAQDLAIIKIDASRPLAVMPLGTSSDLMLGETVIAIGNAFGYTHTVTNGIISQLGRDVEVNEEQSYRNLIQTDASINPGNSGGPLINLDGDVVGINVAIRAGAQRIGFAIPIDDARRVVANLMSIEQLGSASHGLLLQDVKSAEVQKVVVSGARSDGPARQAGFRSGDEIVKVGPMSVGDAVDFERSLLGHRPGEPVEVVVRRDDHLETITLRLGHHRGAPASAGADAVVRANNDESSNDRAWNVLGLRLGRMAAGDQSLAGSRYRGGMRVLDVRSGSPAAMNGIRTGDVLVGLHSWETTKPEDVIWVLSHPQMATFSPLKFYIIRGRETLYGHLQVQMASR